MLLQFPHLHGYGILPAHTTGYPLQAQGDVLSDLQSPRRKPQFSCHHVSPGVHLFPDLYLVPENIPGALLSGSLRIAPLFALTLAGYWKSRPSHPPDPGAPRRAFSHAAFSLRSEAQRTEAYAFASSLAAALLDGHFEHPGRYSPVALNLRAIEFLPCHNRFSADS